MKNVVRVSVVGFILTIAGCGGGLEGKYEGTMPGAIGLAIPATLDFRSGGKVFVKKGSDEKAGTFEVDGDKVTIVVDGQSAVFTLSPQGILAGPNNMTFYKQFRP